MLYVLWGKHKDRVEDWHETVLLDEATSEQCDRVEVLAAKDGFSDFRRVPLDDLRPDFPACIQI
jgi:hypothetical protein